MPRLLLCRPRATCRAPLARFLLAVGLAAAASCTGTISDRPPAGTGPSTGSPGAGAGTGTGTGSQSGTGGAGAGSIPPNPPPTAMVPTSRVIRLSHSQWVNTVKDLLKLSDISAIASTVTGDAVVGFDNDGESLFVDTQLREDLQDAASALTDKVVNDAAALARIMPANAPADVPGKGKAFITAFGQRAFRRPLAATEVQDYVALFAQGPTLYPGGDALASGLKVVLQQMLQSPYFLYRTELSTAATGGKVPLSPYEIAAKLSYALTNTMPDDTLAAAAASGDLANVATVKSQAARLLDSPAGAQGRDNFHFQVFRLGTYDGITRDTTVFKNFTPDSPASMRQEGLSYTRWIYDQNYGVRELYTSPVGFVNKTLAPIYGLPAANFGTDLVKTDLDPTQRAGILTQVGFLSSYALQNDPDSIHRGVFVNQRVLCFKLPPPSPNAGHLIDITPNMTNRERVEMTTGAGTCGEGCHSTWINTAGFAFEEFDALGQYRTMDRGKTISSADTYPFTDGAKSYSGAAEFARAIADGQQAHDCYTQNWVTYLNGRQLAPEEMPLVSWYARKSRAGQMSMKDLILATVTADNFLNRLP